MNADRRVWHLAIMLAVLILLSSKSCSAADPWDRTDKALAGVLLAATVVDYGQTLHIARNPQDHWEAVNPLMRRHPSTTEVTTYFAAATAGKLVIAHCLSSRYRKAWLGGWSAVSIGLVFYNNRPGAGIRVEW